MNYDDYKLSAPPLREIKEETCDHCGGSGKVEGHDGIFDECLICNGSGTIETD